MVIVQYLAVGTVLAFLLEWAWNSIDSKEMVKLPTSLGDVSYPERVIMIVLWPVLVLTLVLSIVDHLINNDNNGNNEGFSGR